MQWRRSFKGLIQGISVRIRQSFMSRCQSEYSDAHVMQGLMRLRA